MFKHPVQVIVLLGPVGAGKSTVGRLIQRELGGLFLSIEELFIQQYQTYDTYAANRDQAYKMLEQQIIDAVEAGRVPLIFEEIAISPNGENLVAAISRRFATDLICVQADLNTCKLRVVKRGTSKNFDKSDSAVEAAWDAFSKIKSSLQFKAEIRNENQSEQWLVEQIRKIWA